MRVVVTAVAVLVVACGLVLGVAIGTGAVRAAPGSHWPSGWPAEWTLPPGGPSPATSAAEGGEPPPDDADLVTQVLGPNVGARTGTRLDGGAVRYQWTGGQLYAVVTPSLQAGADDPAALRDPCGDAGVRSTDDDLLDETAYLVVTGTIDPSSYSAGHRFTGQMWFLGQQTAGDLSSSAYVALPADCTVPGRLVDEAGRPGTSWPALDLVPGQEWRAQDAQAQLTFALPTDGLVTGSLDG